MKGRREEKVNDRSKKKKKKKLLIEEIDYTMMDTNNDFNNENDEDQ